VFAFFARLLLVVIFCLVMYFLFRPEGATDPVDVWTEAEIRAELDLHPGLRPMHLDVRVKDGVVTLRGRVASAKQEELVVSFAQRVPTVGQVGDEIEVAGGTAGDEGGDEENEAAESVNDDAQLQHQVQAILLSNSDICDFSIKAGVNGGIVVLEGQVPDELDRVEIEAVVMDVRGVENIANHIRVSSDGNLAARKRSKSVLSRFRMDAVDDWLKAKVELRLAGLKSSADRNISASVKNRVVTLQGQVDSTELSERIAAAMGKIVGVTDVRNEIESIS
jgi:osmotically-inducible protein OsmY